MHDKWHQNKNKKHRERMRVATESKGTLMIIMVKSNVGLFAWQRHKCIKRCSRLLDAFHTM